MNKEELRYFVGKVCTIFTIPINRNFKDENPTLYPQQLYNYFLGKIESVSDSGITMIQPGDGKRLKSFFFYSHIIALAEETIFDPDDPTDAKIIETIKTNQTAKIPKPKEDKHINPANLAEMAKQIEKNFGA